MQRSHSRHTYPADKMIPVDVIRGPFPLTRVGRQVVKQMHSRKARYYARLLVRLALRNTSELS